MRFSVLIPVYNVERYLPECLKSLDEQNYKDFEVVLVDDGATDLSPQICDEYASNRKNVKIIHKENAGLISSRREGIKVASGEFCIFLDSDDLLEINALNDINKVIINANPDVIIFNAYEYDGVNKKVFFEHVTKEGTIPDRKTVYDEFFKSYKFNPIWLKAVRTSIIDKDRDYSELYKCNFGEDLLQSVPIIKKAETIYYLDKCLYNYREMSGMMHRYNPRYYYSYKSIAIDIQRQLSSENIDELDLKIAKYILIAAYGGTTQLKYSKQKKHEDLKKIYEDAYFQNSYKKVMGSYYRKLLSKKQLLILWLLKAQRYNLIWIILRIRGN